MQTSALVAAEERGLTEPAEAQRLAGVLNRIARQLREARELRRENDLLRRENVELREALADCVEACDRFLAPTLEPGEHAEDDDRARARQALDAGRRLLGRRLGG